MVDGRIALPAKLGLDVALNMDAVRRYEVDAE